MKENNNQKGITLIALIITIIVMLILVGVTVTVALNGGLFETASDAAKGTNKERIKEEMTSVVLGFANENLLADANINDLKQELSKIKGVTSVEGNSFPIIVKGENGNEWTIDEYGSINEKIKVEEVEKVISADNPEASYWKVDENGTLLYYEVPEGVEVPETLIIPCKIGDKKITKIEDGALFGLIIQRNEYGKAMLTEDGNCIFLDEEGNEVDDPIFGQTTSVKNIVISKGIEEIGSGAFSCCVNLESVNIPSTVTTIGDGAFSECTSLTSIDIPEGVTTIGDSAFSGCTSLTSIDIPEGVITIENEAFYGCTSIKEITIPSSVDNLGARAFGYWTNTQIIYVKGKTEQPPDVDNDSYNNIGWAHTCFEPYDVTIVWDK